VLLVLISLNTLATIMFAICWLYIDWVVAAQTRLHVVTLRRLDIIDEQKLQENLPGLSSLNDTLANWISGPALGAAVFVSACAITIAVANLVCLFPYLVYRRRSEGQNREAA
jgi:hypothetical protein